MGASRRSGLGRGLVRSAALVLLLTGCGGVFTVPDPEPRRVLDPRWMKILHANPVLTYRPRELATPAVDAKTGTVYLGSNDGALFALDAATGRERWRHRTSGPIWSAPLLTADALYVGNADGQVVALDRKTGAPLWDEPFVVEGAIEAAPAAAGGRLFVTLDTNEVRAIDAAAGDALWSYRREHLTAFTLAGQAPPVVWEDSVFTGFSDGSVVALRVEDGSVVWERSLASEATRFDDVDGAPVVQGDVLYVAAHASGVWALDARTGAERWHHEAVGALAVAVAGERVWYTNVERPAVVCLDRAAGAPVWRSTFDRGAPAAPLAAAGFVFVSTTDDLYVVDGETGRFVERFAPAEGFSAPPAAAGGRLFVLSNRGYLHAMDIH